jgi:hypothetical protein
MTTITTIFGSGLSDVAQRQESYDLLRNFIAQNHDWNGGRAPDSDLLVCELKKTLQKINDQNFAFLLCHSGYIPEEYDHDSSEETIYTKLVEALVEEWARRIGFNETVLPKQKSSKEDVTIKDAENIIVCDAKSYRLGRSQKAPNVKDALKEGDISKWLSAYCADSRTQLGGLITFPSQHDWSGGSDFYLYLTKKELPIVCLFYEHLAYVLLSGVTKQKLIDLYCNYDNLFPAQLKKSDGNKAKYWLKVLTHLFGDITEWNNFKSVAQTVIQEKVFHTIQDVKCHLSDIRDEISREIPVDASAEDLREMLIEARCKLKTLSVSKQLSCIHKFRDHLESYIVMQEEDKN